ncbi:MAG: hypothetical protein A2X25_07435 [Chloroflexi bacterium GWB2_49_20]|nr:MAG: hypothetical protein A2X25_07435 [Chloroflexi bacterium GWB2_49_20]OGN77987.1 MAG: hypothetical protein A2X26_15240 [Chloroflexi bacterium GWC2_49_37]OGN85025.1 MAG: hypothetical protein A2X27_09940 [Chloroflexi bacterium GWD2_49_16]HBG74939.1 hypothetical protein [Anaerolineae bacterium]HCC78337.1 hypothetical protein [Anaerolineae bacterium]
MSTKQVFFSIDTKKPIQEVVEATKKSLMFLGGQIVQHSDGVIVKQGINGVNFAFIANFEAYINIRQSDPSKYELFGTINWSPNVLFWVCILLGFFSFAIFWIVPALYLFIDPTSVYQQALMRINSFLN